MDLNSNLTKINKAKILTNLIGTESNPEDFWLDCSYGKIMTQVISSWLLENKTKSVFDKEFVIQVKEETSKRYKIYNSFQNRENRIKTMINNIRHGLKRPLSEPQEQRIISVLREKSYEWDIEDLKITRDYYTKDYNSSYTKALIECDLIDAYTGEIENLFFAVGAKGGFYDYDNYKEEFWRFLYEIGIHR